MNTIERRLRDQRQVTVRPARGEDAQATLDHLAAIYTESNFLTRGPGDFERNLSAQEDFIRAYSEAPLKLFLVALVATELVATLTFSGNPLPRLRHTGELGMAVRKAFWDLGIGSSLLDLLIDWARTTGVITKLNLRVRSDNTRAIHLYQRKGFVTEGTVTREHLIDGRYFSQDCMGLEL
jgi:RimJ/RimL family protein N-acetyltransferase